MYFYILHFSTVATKDFLVFNAVYRAKGFSKRAETAEENGFDEEGAVKELDNRMTKLEGQMSDLLTTIKDGFETMEASQEVAFRAFYNAQKRQRANGSPSKFGSPQRGE